MRSIIVITMAALLLGTSTDAKTVQDRNIHLIISCSQSGAAQVSPQINGSNGYNLPGNVKASFGARGLASLTRSISRSFAVGVQGSVYAQVKTGDQYQYLKTAAAGYDLLGIVEYRCALSSVFGFKGTLGVGKAWYVNPMSVCNWVDQEIYPGYSVSVPVLSNCNFTQSATEILIQPAIELRLSSVVSFDFFGSYRHLPTKYSDAIMIQSVDDAAMEIPRFKTMESSFTLGVGLGLHMF